MLGYGIFTLPYRRSGAEAYAGIETWGRDLEADYPVIAKFIQDYVARTQPKR